MPAADGDHPNETTSTRTPQDRNDNSYLVKLIRLKLVTNIIRMSYSPWRGVVNGVDKTRTSHGRNPNPGAFAP